MRSDIVTAERPCQAQRPIFHAILEGVDCCGGRAFSEEPGLMVVSNASISGEKFSLLLPTDKIHTILDRSVASQGAKIVTPDWSAFVTTEARITYNAHPAGAAGLEFNVFESGWKNPRICRNLTRRLSC
jgi:hypothetical protein